MMTMLLNDVLSFIYKFIDNMSTEAIIKQIVIIVCNVVRRTNY